MAYAKGGFTCVPCWYFDITLEFPEYPEGINLFRFRRVGPCASKTAALRRILNPRDAQFDRSSHKGRDFTSMKITIRKVDSFE